MNLKLNSNLFAIVFRHYYGLEEDSECSILLRNKKYAEGQLNVIGGGVCKGLIELSNGRRAYCCV